jgi:hypothetical protein
MKLEKPAFPWGELFDIIVQGLLGGVIIMAVAWGLLRCHFPVEAVVQ